MTRDEYRMCLRDLHTELDAARASGDEERVLGTMMWCDGCMRTRSRHARGAAARCSYVTSYPSTWAPCGSGWKAKSGVWPFPGGP